jgi:5'-methylthioadenosine phosphorylase
VTAPALPHAAVGVFGGSGFYRFLDDPVEVAVQTPFGPPSALLHVGTIDDTPVAFLARHGPNHETPAHRVNYRANVWAMRRLGVRRLLSPCAVGSLRRDVHPGEFVVCDQLVDRTSGRAATFFDGPLVNSTSFADPYCPELRAAIVEAARAEGIAVHDRGTVVVIQGPRFSTRAESRWFQTAGWDVVNMTQYPEAVLARELGVCFANISLVTDYDAGVEDDAAVAAVDMDTVLRVMNENVDKVRALLTRVIPAVPTDPGTCACAAGAIDPGTFPA